MKTNKILNIILVISLIFNGIMFYECSILREKIQFIEKKYFLLQNQLNTTDGFYIYLIVGLLVTSVLISFMFFNNNFNYDTKINEYQGDNIKILSDILNNTSLEKTEHIYSQLQTILLNQQIIIAELHKINTFSFVADPSASQLAAQLLEIASAF